LSRDAAAFNSALAAIERTRVPVAMTNGQREVLISAGRPLSTTLARIVSTVSADRPITSSQLKSLRMYTQPFLFVALPKAPQVPLTATSPNK
jgi:hypothetical protein